MKAGASLCAVLGDVVGSRRAPDRAEVHNRLQGAVALVGGQITVGDEFQARYATLGEAIAAALRVRLELWPHVDVRFGIGRGAILDLDEQRAIQDGPAWWAARAAIDGVRAASQTRALRSLRTAYRCPEDPAGEAAVNAALALRDQMLAAASDRSVRLFTGLVAGHTQADLAGTEGISRSAVSQQVGRQGVGALLHAQALLAELP